MRAFSSGWEKSYAKSKWLLGLLNRHTRESHRDHMGDAFLALLEGQSHQLVYCTVRESKHRVIYVVRVQDEILEPFELENIAELMRDKLAARGELMAEVVTMQGTSRETLRLSGSPYSVSLVRIALFNAAVSWTPINLDR